ncbi:MAG: FAD binding domain-containing protein [Gemmatimonadota bacterium]|nr:FAD binding domain-containing protein [Gemmatimonadota bacterium]
MLRLPTFEFLQPKTVEEAVLMKKEAGPDGMYVAGGTDLYPNMKRRQQEPQVVISLGGIEALNKITAAKNGTGATIGASVTLAQIAADESIKKDYPAVAEAARLVSTPTLRNMGTIGGNLCLDTRCNYYDQNYEWRKSISFCMKKDGDTCWVAPSSPRCWAVSSSDVAPVMVAIGAEYVVHGPDGERTVSAGDFYADDGIEYLSKKPDEILTQIKLPTPGNWNATYLKLRRRGSFDFPVLGVAAWIDWEGKTVKDARIVLGGVASYPSPMDAAKDLVDTSLDETVIQKVADGCFKPAKPMDNTDHGLAWRKEMTRVFVKRALVELAG